MYFTLPSVDYKAGTIYETIFRVEHLGERNKVVYLNAHNETKNTVIPYYVLICFHVCFTFWTSLGPHSTALKTL